MKIFKFIIYILLPIQFLFSSDKNFKKQIYISSSYGIQISGIKSEDFLISNVAPTIKLKSGIWFSNEIGLQIAYNGPYFYYIEDNDKHHYNFYHGEVILNINEIISYPSGKVNFLTEIGAGYFYNKYYNRPNICMSLGLKSSFEMSKNYEVFLDFSSIMGWDIFQANEDILPQIGIGAIYNFRMN